MTRSTLHNMGKQVSLGYGRGGYRQLASRKWEISYTSNSGARKWEYADSRAEAEARLHEVWIAKLNGYELELAGVPFQQLCDEFKVAKATDICHSTMVGYRDIIEHHFTPALGRTIVEEMITNPGIIDAYRNGKLGGVLDDDGREFPPPPVTGKAKRVLAPRTVRTHLLLLNQIFELGVSRGRIRSNPMTNVKLPSVSRKNVSAFEPELIHEVFELLEGDEKMLAAFLLSTGCRLGEAQGLRRSSLVSDPRRCGIDISRSVKRQDGREVVEEGGKTDSALRFIPCSPEFMLAMQSYERLAPGPNIPDDDPFVFRYKSTGRPINQANFRNRHWLPAIYTVALRHLSDAKFSELVSRLPIEHSAMLAALRALPGASIADIRAIQIGDYDPETGQLTPTAGSSAATLIGTTRELLDRQFARASENPGVRKLLFPGSRGLPVSVEKFTRIALIKPFDRCEIPVMRRVHNLRHTYATVQIERGTTDSMLSYWMGHARPSYSADEYGHIRKALKQAPADIYHLIETSDGSKRFEDAA